MGKFHVIVRTKFGEIRVEGDSSKEVLDLVKEALSLEGDVDKLMPSERIIPTATPAVPTVPTVGKKELDQIIEVTADGRPQVIFPPEKLSAREVIGLLLYWKYPGGFSANELKDLVSLSWKTVDQGTVTARIADLKGLVVKEGPKGKFTYKLSGSGKSWIERDLFPRLKGEKDKE